MANFRNPESSKSTVSDKPKHCFQDCQWSNPSQFPECAICEETRCYYESWRLHCTRRIQRASQFVKQRGKTIKSLLRRNSELKEEIEQLKLKLAKTGKSDSTASGESDNTNEDEELFYFEQEHTMDDNPAHHLCVSSTHNLHTPN